MAKDFKTGGFRTTDPKQEAQEFFLKCPSFKNEWINVGADNAMPDFVDAMGKTLAAKGLTTSKIRSIYGEIKRIEMAGYEREKASFFLLKPKMAYATGRDDKNVGLQLFKLLFDTAYVLVHDDKTFINFCKLMEAVLAYHKFYHPKEN